MSDRIPVRLTGLPGQLHAAGYEPVPDYRKLHLKAVNGDIPGAPPNQLDLAFQRGRYTGDRHRASAEAARNRRQLTAASLAKPPNQMLRPRAPSGWLTTGTRKPAVIGDEL